MKFKVGKKHGHCVFKLGDGENIKKCGQIGVMKCNRGYVCNEYYEIIKFNQKQGVNNEEVQGVLF